jgi:multidrug efflux system membrane fusion protein
VTVEVLDLDGKPFDRGSLQVVDNQVDPTTGTVRMKAEFPNTTLQLWPGQFVNVRVLIDTMQQVVVVPTPAVQRGPNGTFSYVVQDGDRVALRPVTVALQNENQAVISKGINAGDRVVTSGFSRLKDGARIVLPDETPPAAAAPKKEEPAATAVSERRGKARAACAEDVQKFCPDVEHSKDAIRGCLRSHATELSDACKAASAGRRGGREREADVRQAEGSAVQ